MNAKSDTRESLSIFNTDVHEQLDALGNVFHLTPIERDCALSIYKDRFMSFQFNNSANENFVMNMTPFQFSIFSASLLYKTVKKVREMSIILDNDLDRDIQLTLCDPQQKLSLIDEINANIKAEIAMK